MSYIKIIHFTVVLCVFAQLCEEAQGKLTVFAPVGPPQGFLNTNSAHAQANAFIIGKSENAEHGSESQIIASQIFDANPVDGKSKDGKSLLNPLRKMAESVKILIEEYTKRRNLVQKNDAENRYNELLKDANDLAKEIEAASNEHDIRMEEYQKGDVKSGKQAVRLTELIQSRTQPFNSLLWRMDQVIAEIKNDSAVPDRPLSEEFAPTSKLIPLTSRVQQEDVALQKPTSIEDEGDNLLDTQKYSVFGQSVRLEDEELDRLSGG